MANTLQTKTVFKGVFTTSDGNVHPDTDAKSLHDSGKETVKIDADDYTFDSKAYVARLLDEKFCPFWMREVHLSTKNNDGATIGLAVHWIHARKDICDSDSAYSPVFICGWEKSQEPRIGTLFVRV